VCPQFSFHLAGFLALRGKIPMLPDAKGSKTEGSQTGERQWSKQYKI
jgi:hypothetical protein